MRIAKIIGSVTLNRCHPTFEGTNLRLVIPQTLDSLIGTNDTESDTLVGWEELGSGSGSTVAIAEGPEASQPFRPEIKPVDCYVSAILDNVSLDPTALKQIKN